MVGQRWVLPVIVSIAILLALGMMLIWVACALDASWALLIVVVFPLLGTMFPCMCGGYNFDHVPGYLQDTSNYVAQNWSDVGFLMEGLCLVSGLFMPLVMFRAGSFSSSKPVYLSLAGETCIWAAVILYLSVFFYGGTTNSGNHFGDL